MLLELGLDRGLDLLNPPHQLLDLRAGCVVQQRNSRTGAGSVSGRGDLGKITVRNHAEQHGVFDVDVTAECAGEPYPIDVIGSHVLH